MSRFDRPRRAYEYDYTGGRSFWDTRTFVGIDDDHHDDDDVGTTDHYSRATLGRPRRRSAAPASVIGYGDLEFRPWSTSTTTTTTTTPTPTARPLITYDWDLPHHSDIAPSRTHRERDRDRERVRIRPPRQRDATLPPHHHSHTHHNSHPHHHNNNTNNNNDPPYHSHHTHHPLPTLHHHHHPLRPALKPSHSAGLPLPLPDLQHESLKQRLRLDHREPYYASRHHAEEQQQQLLHQQHHRHLRARSLSLGRLAGGFVGGGGGGGFSDSSYEPESAEEEDGDGQVGGEGGEEREGAVWDVLPRVPTAPPRHRPQKPPHRRLEDAVGGGDADVDAGGGYYRPQQQQQQQHERLSLANPRVALDAAGWPVPVAVALGGSRPGSRSRPGSVERERERAVSAVGDLGRDRYERGYQVVAVDERQGSAADGGGLGGVEELRFPGREKLPNPRVPSGHRRRRRSESWERVKAGRKTASPGVGGRAAS